MDNADFCRTDLLNRIDTVLQNIKDNKYSEGVEEEIFDSLERYTCPELQSETDKTLLKYLFRGWMMTKMSENK